MRCLSNNDSLGLGPACGGPGSRGVTSDADRSISTASHPSRSPTRTEPGQIAREHGIPRAIVQRVIHEQTSSEHLLQWTPLAAAFGSVIGEAYRNLRRRRKCFQAATQELRERLAQTVPSNDSIPRRAQTAMNAIGQQFGHHVGERGTIVPIGGAANAFLLKDSNDALAIGRGALPDCSKLTGEPIHPEPVPCR